MADYYTWPSKDHIEDLSLLRSITYSTSRTQLQMDTDLTSPFICLINQVAQMKQLRNQSEASDSLQFDNFVKLPYEIRCMVYQSYFTSWSASIYYNVDEDRFQLSGLPSQSLLLTSRAIHQESRRFMKEAFTGRLNLKDVKVQRKGKFGFQSSLEVIATMGINELLSNVRTVIIENGTTGMLVLLPWYKFKQLRYVELDERLKTAPFANGKISPYWPFESELDVDGGNQFFGVFGYEKWTCVPDCVSQGQVRVVSVKRGYSAGATLKTIVEHKADRGEFLERVCEDEDGGWRMIMQGGGL